jgi:hypothetical protein
VLYLTPSFAQQESPDSVRKYFQHFPIPSPFFWHRSPSSFEGAVILDAGQGA